MNNPYSVTQRDIDASAVVRPSWKAIVLGAGTMLACDNTLAWLRGVHVAKFHGNSLHDPFSSTEGLLLGLLTVLMSGILGGYVSAWLSKQSKYRNALLSVAAFVAFSIILAFVTAPQVFQYRMHIMLLPLVGKALLCIAGSMTGTAIWHRIDVYVS